MSSEIPVQFNLPKELHKKLKVAAAREGCTMREYIVAAIIVAIKAEQEAS